MTIKEIAKKAAQEYEDKNGWEALTPPELESILEQAIQEYADNDNSRRKLFEIAKAWLNYLAANEPDFEAARFQYLDKLIRDSIK